MRTLTQVLQQAPQQDGDNTIKQSLVNAIGNFNTLDKVINKLSEQYTLEQIFKVYYQNFT